VTSSLFAFIWQLRRISDLSSGTDKVEPAEEGGTSEKDELSANVLHSLHIWYPKRYIIYNPHI